MTGDGPESRIPGVVSTQETLPTPVRSRQRTGGPRRRADGRRNSWRRTVVIVTALALLLSGGTALAAALGGSLPLPFLAGLAAKPTIATTLAIRPLPLEGRRQEGRC